MRPSRTSSLVIVVLCAIVLPALGGLIAGGIAAPEPPPPDGELIGGRSVTLLVPSSWRRVERARPIPGLTLKEGIALAPRRQGVDAGLVAGQVSTGGQGPLPRSLLKRVRGDLGTEVVSVGTWDGYRYGQLRVAGFPRRLVVYAVPTASGAAAVACYAADRAAAYLPACERIARTLDIAAGTEAGWPNLSRGYGRSLRAAIGRLDARRVAQRARLKADAAPGQAAAATRRLADAYASAARALGGVDAPSAVGAAHAVLVKRLWSSRDAYRRLTTAARAEDLGRWNEARRAVRRAEASVSVALGDLGVLGYGRRA